MSALASFPPPAFFVLKEISPCPLCSLFFLSLPLPRTHTQASPLCACTNTRKQIICRIQQCSFMSGRNTSNTWQQGQEQHKAEHRTKAKLVKVRKRFEFRGVTNYHVRKKHGATHGNTEQHMATHGNKARTTQSGTQNQAKHQKKKACQGSKT